jgi:hypothetical protein
MQLSRSASISVITLYWSTVALGSLALLFSMVTTLWGPRLPGAQATLSERRTWCVGQLALLHAELQHETQAALGPYFQVTPATTRRREHWQRGWSERFDAINTQCGKPQALGEALQQLGVLAQRYDAIVLAWQRAQDSLNTPIEAAVHRLVDPWYTDAQTPQG